MRAIGDVHVGLRGDRSDAWYRPGDERSNREPVGLHRHAQLTGAWVVSHDRIGHSIDTALDGTEPSIYRPYVDNGVERATRRPEDSNDTKSRLQRRGVVHCR